MIITTESGAIYEWDDPYIRRVNQSAQKRGDSYWQETVTPIAPKIGERMVIVMKSLAFLGPDDYGTPVEKAGPYTTRSTTPVVSID